MNRQAGKRRLDDPGASNQASPLATLLAAPAAGASAWGLEGFGVDQRRGKDGMHGSFASTLFNTVARPNSNNGTRAACSPTGSGSAAQSGEADSLHPGGINVPMGDGSVKFSRSTIRIRTWWPLGTRAGAGVVGADSSVSGARSSGEPPADRGRAANPV